MPRIFTITKARYAPPPTTPSLDALVLGTTVRWSAGSTPAPGQTVTYTYERSTASAAGPFSLLATTTATMVESVETPGTTVFGRVIASQTDGQSSGYSAVASAVIAPVSTFAPNFPALATYYVGEGTWSSGSGFYAKVAPCSMLLFSHFYSSGNIVPVMAAIKSQVPAGVGATPIYAIYVVQNECYPPDADYFYGEYRAKYNAENWWLRTTYPAGGIVPAAFADQAPGTNELNNTAGGFADVDANGKDLVTWHCETAVTHNITGGTVFGSYTKPANPYCDACFCDNIFWQKRVDGDYNRDGVTDDNESVASRDSVQAGEKKYADTMRALLPDAPVLGNMDLFLANNDTIWNEDYTPDYSKVTALYQIFDGGIANEFLLYNGWPSFEGSQTDPASGLAGFRAVRNQMRFMHGMVRQPRMLMFSTYEVTHDGSAADNQRLRFAIALVGICSNGMLDDRGQFNATSSTQHPYYTNNGAGHGWLGQPVSETPVWSANATGPNAANVYVREFANGYLAVNPRHNGARSISLPVNVRNIATGTNYNAGSAIPMADRDGLLLLKV